MAAAVFTARLVRSVRLTRALTLARAINIVRTLPRIRANFNVSKFRSPPTIHLASGRKQPRDTIATAKLIKEHRLAMGSVEVQRFAAEIIQQTPATVGKERKAISNKSGPDVE